MLRSPCFLDDFRRICQWVSRAIIARTLVGHCDTAFLSGESYAKACLRSALHGTTAIRGAIDLKPTKSKRMHKRGRILAAALSLTVAGAVATVSNDAQAQQRIYNGAYYRSLLVGRVNPLGLFEDFRMGYRWRTFQGSQDPLAQNTYFAASGTLGLSPAFVRPGVMVEAQPLSLLHMFVQYEWMQWFGTFGYLQSFTGTPSTINYSDARINQLRDPSRPDYMESAGPYRGNIHIVTFGFTPQIRLGDIALRSQNRFFYFAANTRNGPDGQPQPFWYDTVTDMLMPSNGWAYTSDTDLLYVTSFGLTIGARYSYTRTFLPNLDPSQIGPAGEIDRVGPIMLWQITERRRSWFNAPTIILLAQWWLRHPWRGAVNGTQDPEFRVNPALPWIGFGLLWRGDT